MPRTIETNKARQGRTGWQVLIVLLCALALTLIVWWGVGLYGSAIAPEEPTNTAPVEEPEASGAPEAAPPAQQPAQ